MVAEKLGENASKERGNANKETRCNNVLIDMEALVKNEGKYLKMFLYKKVWNHDEVDDLYQTTLLEALKAKDSFRGESTPRTWLCGIAYRVFKGYLKKKYRTPFDSIDIDSFIREENISEDNFYLVSEGPEDIVERQQLINIVSKTFSNLPKDIKKTSYNVIIDENSYESASKIDRIPVGTVRSRVARARFLFRQKYSNIHRENYIKAV